MVWLDVMVVGRLMNFVLFVIVAANYDSLFLLDYIRYGVNLYLQRQGI